MNKIKILGAGLSGISSSFNLGHENCLVYEKNYYPGGLIHTEFLNGFTWDQGPHLSFTKHNYVKNLFSNNVDGEYFEYSVETANYFNGHWIPHPAQTNLYAVPQPLREKCLQDFLLARQQKSDAPSNYHEWLYYVFGKSFAENFPSAYTRKYWTTDPANLTTDWVGERVYFPSVEDVSKGAIAPLNYQTYYITVIRYPQKGGYFEYAKKMTSGSSIKYNSRLTHISFKNREIFFSSGMRSTFEKLIITIPLPILIYHSDAPAEVQEAANRLSCTSVLLVNVVAKHSTIRPEHWIYIYDEEKHSTRIYCTEKLSPQNAPKGKSGIQVEVYFSKYKPINQSAEHIALKVCDELVEMGIVKSFEQIESVHTKWEPWANVLFDHNRRESLDTILKWLEQFGLSREDDDLEPMTNWNKKISTAKPIPKQTIFLAGRFAQWKYYWTDDCVMRSLYLSKLINN